jgi:hypothetical protein
MKIDGCTRLHGGLFLFQNSIVFFQQKLVIIVLKLQLHDWGSEVYRRLGLEANNKICNVRHNVGLIVIFSG